MSRGNTYALNISARNKNKVFQNVKVFIPFLSGRMSNIWGEGLLSVGWEDPLPKRREREREREKGEGKGYASILAWRVPWTV